MARGRSSVGDVGNTGLSVAGGGLVGALRAPQGVGCDRKGVRVEIGGGGVRIKGLDQQVRASWLLPSDGRLTGGSACGSTTQLWITSNHTGGAVAFCRGQASKKNKPWVPSMSES